ncbi:MAG: glucokinase [Halothiobacillaceae bacterium]
MFLAGDIGGTKTVLALYGLQDGGLVCERESSYPSRDYAQLSDIINLFLGVHRPALHGAAFGVAGPVVNRQSITTNLPWVLDECELEVQLDCPVRLLNDLEAAALGMLHLAADQCVVLSHARRSKDGMMAVIAAGTGLGEALLFWDGTRYHAQPTEGGHCSFAPTTADEDGLLHYMRNQLGGHVSVERVLSGPGLYNIWCFLRDSGRGNMDANTLRSIENATDPSAEIAHRALAGSDSVCIHALDMFVHIYGSEAANLALKSLATGGVLIGGGIAPKILPFLQRSAFMDGFLNKGRFRGLLETIPVEVVLEPRAPLLGAAHLAYSLA